MAGKRSQEGKGQQRDKEKNKSSPLDSCLLWCFNLSRLRNLPFMSPSPRILEDIQVLPWNFLLLSHLSLHHKHLPSPNWACWHCRCWQRTAAFSTPSFYPHAALLQLLTPWTTLFLCWLPHKALSSSVLTLGTKCRRDTFKSLPFALISVPQVSRKLYSILLQHTCLVCKLLSHVCTVSTYQKVHPIIVTMLKPI